MEWSLDVSKALMKDVYSVERTVALWAGCLADGKVDLKVVC